MAGLQNIRNFWKQIPFRNELKTLGLIISITAISGCGDREVDVVPGGAMKEVLDNRASDVARVKNLEDGAASNIKTDSRQDEKDKKLGLKDQELEAKDSELEKKDRDLTQKDSALDGKAKDIIARQEVESKEAVKRQNENLVRDKAQDIRITEHGGKLAEHGGKLAEHGGKLAEHGGKLAEHGGKLAEHGGKLAEHGGKLAEHGGKLAEHGGKLAEHGGKLAEQLALLTAQGKSIAAIDAWRAMNAAQVERLRIDTEIMVKAHHVKENSQIDRMIYEASLLACPTDKPTLEARLGEIRAAWGTHFASINNSRGALDPKIERFLANYQDYIAKPGRIFVQDRIIHPMVNGVKRNYSRVMVPVLTPGLYEQIVTLAEKEHGEKADGLYIETDCFEMNEDSPAIETNGRDLTILAKRVRLKAQKKPPHERTPYTIRIKTSPEVRDNPGSEGQNGGAFTLFALSGDIDPEFGIVTGGGDAQAYYAETTHKQAMEALRTQWTKKAKSELLEPVLGFTPRMRMDESEIDLAMRAIDGAYPVLSTAGRFQDTQRDMLENHYKEFPLNRVEPYEQGEMRNVIRLMDDLKKVPDFDTPYLPYQQWKHLMQEKKGNYFRDTYVRMIRQVLASARDERMDAQFGWNPVKHGGADIGRFGIFVQYEAYFEAIRTQYDSSLTPGAEPATFYVNEAELPYQQLSGGSPGLVAINIKEKPNHLPVVLSVSGKSVDFRTSLNAKEISGSIKVPPSVRVYANIQIVTGRPNGPSVSDFQRIELVGKEIETYFENRFIRVKPETQTLTWAGRYRWDSPFEFPIRVRRADIAALARKDTEAISQKGKDFEEIRTLPPQINTSEAALANLMGVEDWVRTPWRKAYFSNTPTDLVVQEVYRERFIE